MTSHAAELPAALEEGASRDPVARLVWAEPQITVIAANDAEAFGFLHADGGSTFS